MQTQQSNFDKNIYRKVRIQLSSLMTILNLREGTQAFLLFIPDFAILLLRLMRNSKVSLYPKLGLLLGLIYLLLPFDVVPDSVFVIGLLDDTLIIIFSVMRLVIQANKSNPNILRQYWEGDYRTIAITNGLFTLFADIMGKAKIVQQLSRFLRMISQHTR